MSPLKRFLHLEMIRVPLEEIFVIYDLASALGVRGGKPYSMATTDSGDELLTQTWSFKLRLHMTDLNYALETIQDSFPVLLPNLRLVCEDYECSYQNNAPLPDSLKKKRADLRVSSLRVLDLLKDIYRIRRDLIEKVPKSIPSV